jgi:Fe-S cluster assembly protein SufD
VTEPNLASRPGRPSPGGPSGLLGVTRAALGSAPTGGGRTGDVRAEGAEWFESQGFPSPRDEAWRFTPLAPVLRVPYARSSARPVTEPFAGLTGPRVVISNGHLVSAAALAGVDVGTRARPFPDLERLLDAHLGRAARIDDGFAAQNAALFEDVVVIRVKEGATLAAPVVIVHAAGGGDSPLLSVPRVLVVAEAGSDATVVQAHVFAGGAPVLESSVTEVVVLPGARLEHVRLHQGTPESAAVARVSVRQARDSSYASRVFTFGGALARLTLNVLLEGAGASAVLDGLYLADGGDILDHHTTVDHASPHCTSHERYKGTLDGTGVAVFDGTVIVRRGASKTEGHQENRNLLLSNDAIVHTKPHLRIDTDDVKCSHGATVGRLDPAQLFYLRSRGIDEGVARSMLIFAFAQEMTEGVRSQELREALATRIAARLPGGEQARELT